MPTNDNCAVGMYLGSRLSIQGCRRSNGIQNMNCPVCKMAMIERDFGGVVVHVCENGCKGIWFDWLGLSKLDKSNEGVGQALQDALHYPRVNDTNRGQLNCPKC